MTARDCGDGNIEVIEWDYEEEFSRELLDASPVIEMGDGVVVITAANGTWTYGITGFTERTVTTRLLRHASTHE